MYSFDNLEANKKLMSILSLLKYLILIITFLVVGMVSNSSKVSANVEEVDGRGNTIESYDSLQLAFNNAASGSIIMLTSDIHECNVTLASGKILSLHMNDFDIICSDNVFSYGDHFSYSGIVNRGTLNIFGTGNLTVLYSVDIPSGEEVSVDAYGVTNSTGAILYISDVKIRVGVACMGDFCGELSAWGIHTSGLVDLYDVNIQSNSSFRAYAIEAKSNSTYIHSESFLTASGGSEGVSVLYATGGSINIEQNVSIDASEDDFYNSINVENGSVTIGVMDGNVSQSIPNIVGNILYTYGSINFYDGKITGVCKTDQDLNIIVPCSSVMFSIEVDNELVEQSGIVYLQQINNPIEELTSSGIHVAYYKTLSAAFSSATSGNTIKLLDNVDGGVSLSSGRTLTLNLNGNTITYTNNILKNAGTLIINGNGGSIITDGNASGVFYAIENSGTLTINQTNIRATYSEIYSNYTYGIYNTGILNVNNSTIYSERKKGNGAYGIYSTSQVYVSNSTIEVLSYRMSYGIRATGGKISVSNSTLNVTGTKNSYGIYTFGGEVIFSGQIISKTTATYSDSPDAVGISDGVSGSDTGATITILGGTITVSSSDSSTGISTSSRSSVVLMKNGTISSTVSSSNGYIPKGIYSEGSVTIEKGTITATAPSSGWNENAIDAYSLTLGVKDGVISQTNPSISGGINFNGSSNSFYDGVINRGTSLYACQSEESKCSSYFSTLEDDTYWVVDSVNQAYIGRTLQEETVDGTFVRYHGSLQSAFDNAQNGNVIKVLVDFSSSGSLTGNKKLTLNLNDFTISNESQIISIASGSELVIEGPGTLEVEDEGSSSLYGINNAGKLTLNSGYIEIADDEGSTIYGVYNSGEFIMNGGRIYPDVGDDYSDAYAIYNTSSGSVTINSGGIYADSVDTAYGIYNAGTLVVNDMIMKIYGSSISYGITNSGTATINGGTIEIDVNCEYAVGVDNGKNMIINNISVNIDTSTTDAEGYAVYNSGSSLTINNDILGSVYADTAYELNVSSGTTTVRGGNVGSVYVGRSGALIIGVEDGDIYNDRNDTYLEGIYVPYLWELVIYSTAADVYFWDGSIRGENSCLIEDDNIEDCFEAIDEIEEGADLNVTGPTFPCYPLIETNSNGEKVATYMTLSAALSGVTSGNTLDLNMDMELEYYGGCGSGTLAAGKTVIFNLNGWELSDDVASSIIINNGNLTINGGGSYISAIDDSNIVVIKNTGTLVIDDVEIYGDGTYKEDDTIGIESSGNLKIMNSSVKILTLHANSHGIEVTGGNVEIINTEITTDFDTTDTSGFLPDSIGVNAEGASSVIITDSIIKTRNDCKIDSDTIESQCYAYGIYAVGLNSLTITGGSIDVYADNDATGVHVGAGTHIISNVEISADSAGWYDYTEVYGIVNSGNLEVENVTITAESDWHTATGILNEGTLVLKSGIINATTIYEDILYFSIDNNGDLTLGVSDGTVNQEIIYLGQGISFGDSQITRFYDGKIDDPLIELYPEIVDDYLSNITIVENNSRVVIENNSLYLSTEMINELDDDGNVISVYRYLSDSLTNMTNGNTLQLLGNLNECITIDSNKVVNFDLNGNSIYCDKINDNGDVIAIENNGTLTISGDGEVLASNNLYYQIYGIYNNGTLIINGPTINVESIADCSSCEDSNIVSVYNTGNLTIQDGVIKGKTIYLSSGPFGPGSVTGIVNNGGQVVIDYVKVELVSWTHHYGVLNAAGEMIINDIYFYLGEEFVQIALFNSFKNNGDLTIYGSNIELFDELSYLDNIEYSIDNFGVVNIGSKDGIYNMNFPYLLGSVSNTNIINFYDGKININGTYNAVVGNNSFVCDYNLCSTVFNDVEEGATVTEENMSVYLRFNRLAELDASGALIADYETLSEAFSNATSGNTIVLFENLNECNVTLESDKTLTFDLNGKSVTCDTTSSGKSVLKVSGNLTIKDSLEDGLISLVTTVDVGYGIYVYSGGTLTLNSGNISSTSYGDGFHVDDTNYGVYNAGTFNMSGGSIYCYKEDQGWAVYNTSRFSMSGGEIRVVFGDAYGKGVVNKNGTFTMSDGTINVEGAREAIGVNNDGGTFTMNGGTIIAEVSGGISYGMFNENNGTFTLNEGTIYSNASSDSYGVYNSGTFTMNGGNIVSGTYGVHGSATIKSGTITATVGYGVRGESVVFGKKDGTVSTSMPIINGGISSYSSLDDNFKFYDGVINKGSHGEIFSGYYCLGILKCFDESFVDVETGYGFIEDENKAYLGRVIEELNGAGEHVAYYSTLTDAFSNSTSGNTIKLLSNAYSCVLTNSKTLTFDTNGKMLFCENDSNSAGMISNSGTLSIIGNGTILFNMRYDSYYSCGEYDYDDNGDEYCVQGDYLYGYGEVVYNSGTLVIDGPTIKLYAVDNGEEGLGNHVDVINLSSKGANFIFKRGEIIREEWINGEQSGGTAIDFSFPSAYSGTTINVVIGEKDGYAHKDSPVINGLFGSKINYRSVTVNVSFYDGIIYGVGSNGICSENTSCSSFFTEIEEDSTWVYENNSAYIKFLKPVEELNSSGNHVAYYSSLQTAFTSATNGNTLKLLNNISECNVSLASGKVVILNMDGKSIMCDAVDSSVIINNGTLTVKGNGYIEIYVEQMTSYNDEETYGIKNTGTLTLESSTIRLSVGSSFQEYYAGYKLSLIYNMGTFTMNGGSLISNHWVYLTNGIENNEGDVVVNGGSIELTTAGRWSYGIQSTGGSVVFNDGVISISNDTHHVHGIYSTGNVVMNGGSISVDNTDYTNYGIYGYDITITGGSITSIGAEDSVNPPLFTVNAINNLVITGGTIECRGEANVAMNYWASISAKNITIGNKDGNLNIESPLIYGPVRVTGTINFYDGKIYSNCVDGDTDCLTLKDSIDDIETSTEIVEEDGCIYLVIVTNKVEEVTSTGTHVAYYGKLQEAFNNVTNGNTLKLLNNINESEIILASGKVVILDMNGYNIIRSSDVEVCDSSGEAHAITNNGTLTIVGDGIIDPSDSPMCYSGVYGIFNRGTLTMNGGTIRLGRLYQEAISNWGKLIINSGTVSAFGSYSIGINNFGTGELIINGGEIITEASGGSSENAAGIKNSGKVTINGGKITSSDSSDNAMAIYVSGGEVTIVDGQISATSTTGIGYGIFVNSGTLTMGVKDSDIVVEKPSIVGDLGGSIKFYDGNIRGVCRSKDGSVINCASAMSDIEEYAKVVEKNGKIYLEYIAQSFQEFDSSGNPGKIYPSLDIAFEESSIGSIIKLIENSSGCATLASGKVAVVDLNGKVLSCDTGNNASTSLITNNGNLTIKGNGTLEIKGEGASKYGIYNTGTLIIEKGEINLKGSSLVGVYVNSGSLEMKGGNVIVNSTSENGSAKGIYIADGSANLSGGIIQVVSSSNDVFGIHNKGTLTVTKAVISASTNLGDAKGIYNETGTTTLTGGVVNAVSGKGGAYGVSAYDVSMVELSAAVNVSATSTYGLAFDVHSEIVSDSGDNVVSVPVLSDNEVEGITGTIVCEYGSVCSIAPLTFIDYLGNVVSDVSNTIRFDNQVVDAFGDLGVYTVTTVATDSYGNVSDEVVRTYRLVDTTAPVISVSSDAIVLKVGDSVSGLYGATVSDNYDSNLTIEVISDDVDTSKEGTYKLMYRVVDSNGNETIVYRDVIIEAASNNIWIYISIVAGIVVIGLVSFIVIKRRKNK